MGENEKTFTASWDGAVRGLTLAVCLFSIALAILFVLIGFTNIFGDNSKIKVPMLIGAIVIVAVIVLPFIPAPRKYIINQKAVIIRRIWADVEIPLADVTQVELSKYEEVFKGAVRTMGSGGLFGIYGNFQSPGLGKFRAYMTRKNKLVVIKTKDRPFVLSPDKPNKFIRAVDEYLKNQTT